MIRKVIDTIEQYRMPVKDRHLIAAVSGGSDSVALLHVLLTLQPLFGFRLTAAHVHHGIRGEEADRDERFVRSLCARFSVSCQVGRFDVPALAKQRGESVEVCGRQVRYDFLRSVDPEALVATAHHLDDAAETFFLNLARGTGLKGLTGIPPVRGQIIRPLINCTKEEILAYCRREDLPFVTDSTNADTRYRRNLIRATVIPAMKSVNPAFLDVFARDLSLLKKDEACLSALTERALRAAQTAGGYAVDSLLRVPDELLDRVLAAAVYALSGETAEAFHIARLRRILREGGSETINGGKTIRSDGNRLFLYEPPPVRSFAPLTVSALPFQAVFAGKEIEFSLQKQENNQKIYKVMFHFSVDYDTINYPIVIRTRRSGDAFRPAGRKVTKTLKKLFIEKKMTAEQKESAVVISDANGILCVEGCGVDERAAVTAGTQKKIYITIRSNS